MRTFSGPEHTGTRLMNSKIAESLVKIHRAAEEPPTKQPPHESPLAEWQCDWNDRRERINRKLAFIEQQLTELEDIEEYEVPKFSLVGVTDDSEVE